jgi:hypothetical protein
MLMAAFGRTGGGKFHEVLVIPAVQMCTELLVQLMSLSLRRILTGKTKS